MDDVLFALFLLEPLLDFGAGLIGFADIQPVAAGTLGGLGGQNLHNIAVFEGCVNIGDAVVDFCAHHGVADAGVNGVGKVDGGRTCRQGNDTSLGGKDEHFVVKHIDLQGLDIFIRIGILLAFQ